MGFLKTILDTQNIQTLTIAFFFTDYMPGALIILDGNKGDFIIQPISSLEGIAYDGALIGQLRPVIKSFEGHFILKNLWNVISGKVKAKGIRKLFKFAKILMRCAI